MPVKIVQIQYILFPIRSDSRHLSVLVVACPAHRPPVFVVGNRTPQTQCLED